MPFEPDPNKKLEENLKKDGEFLRDVDKGHTPTETGLNLDLGVVRDEHDEVMSDMAEVGDSTGQPGQVGPGVSDAAEPPPYQPDSVQDASATPEAPEAREPAEGPDLEAGPLSVDHAQVMNEMAEVDEDTNPPVADVPDATDPFQYSDPTDPFPGGYRYKAPKGQKVQPKPAPKARGRFESEQLQVEHAETFVEMGRAALEARHKAEGPTPVSSTVPEMERLSFPRDQNQSQVGSAMESVIREQNEWNITLTTLLKTMAENQRQARLELDKIIGYLERIRL